MRVALVHCFIRILKGASCLVISRLHQLRTGSLISIAVFLHREVEVSCLPGATGSIETFRDIRLVSGCCLEARPLLIMCCSQQGQRVMKRDFKNQRDNSWTEQRRQDGNQWAEPTLENNDFEEYYKAQVMGVNLNTGQPPRHVRSDVCSVMSSWDRCQRLQFMDRGRDAWDNQMPCDGVQGIVPEGEWDAFMETLRKPLPTTFRINGRGRFAADLRDRLQKDFFSQFSEKMVVCACPHAPVMCRAWTTSMQAYPFPFPESSLPQSHLQKRQECVLFKSMSRKPLLGGRDLWFHALRIGQLKWHETWDLRRCTGHFEGVRLKRRWMASRWMRPSRCPGTRMRWGGTWRSAARSCASCPS